jgi:hypothetical protein
MESTDFIFGQDEKVKQGLFCLMTLLISGMGSFLGEQVVRAY